jgi:hypothetical protein
MNIRDALRLIVDVVSENKELVLGPAILGATTRFLLHLQLLMLRRELPSLFSHCFLLDFVDTAMDEFLLIYRSFVSLLERMASNET